MDPIREYDYFVAEFYDHVVPYRDRPDTGFYTEMGKLAGGTVLELGCGTGRVLIPMARAGLEIVGLDLSESMLSVCVEQLARERESLRERVHLTRGDMRDFQLGRSFSLVTIPFRAFQHLLTLDDQIACLNCIHRHLKSGGMLILDLFNPSLHRMVDDRYLSEYEMEPVFEMPGGRTILRKSRIIERDLHQQILDVELVYEVAHPGGHQENLVQHITLRYFFRFEVEHLLARAGFEVDTVYADFDRSPYGSKYPGEMIFVARKA